jgi:RNA polymerase sigma factor (sigma-70 family)
LEIKTTLWGNIAEGDRDSYEELYRFFYKKLYNYGRKFTDDETLIEDIAQETFVVIWQKRRYLKPVRYPVTYVYSIYRNALLRRLKENRKYISGTSIQEEPDFAIDQMIFRRETDLETANKLQKAINSITPRQREAIFLRFYEALPYEEVAKTLGISTKATYKLVANALDNLRVELKIPGNLLLVLLAGLRA